MRYFWIYTLGVWSADLKKLIREMASNLYHKIKSAAELQQQNNYLSEPK